MYPRGIGFCIDSPTAPPRVVGLWLFSDHRHVYVCVRVTYKYMWAVPIGWTHWCDLHESAGSCNYQQPMQNLPNLSWHGFREEAPLSADLCLTPLFTRSPRNNRDTLIQRAVGVFSAWGRGRPITSLSPRSLRSHCVVVITTVCKRNVCILLGLWCVLSDQIITAFHCFTVKWLT